MRREPERAGRNIQTQIQCEKKEGGKEVRSRSMLFMMVNTGHLKCHYCN